MPKWKIFILVDVLVALAVIGGVWWHFNRGGVNANINAPQSASAGDTNQTNAQHEPDEVLTQTYNTFHRSMPPMTIDKTKHYTAVLHTSEGDITIALNAAATPITVNNFVSLAKDNFYHDTIFHRVIKGFMIQGGDPTGTGMGGPGYQFNDEPFQGDYTRGTVAMANAGPNTNGSQFFIMQADYPLPKNYVIFGKVIAGMDVVDKIANAPVTMSDSGEDSKPASPVMVTGVEISEK